jgi:hypothetical protein
VSFHLKVVSGHEYFPVFEYEKDGGLYYQFILKNNIVTLTYSDIEKRIWVTCHRYHPIIKNIINNKSLALLNIHHPGIYVKNICELVLKGVIFEIVEIE